MDRPAPSPMSIEPQHYPIVIAVASLIVVPVVVKLATYLWALWAERRDARIDAAIAGKLTGYATTEELDMHIDTLRDQQEAHHAQNRELLKSIKDDGLRREGLIIGQIKQAQDENRANDTKQESAMTVLHGRIDRVLELQGDRRA